MTFTISFYEILKFNQVPTQAVGITDSEVGGEHSILKEDCEIKPYK